MQTDLLFLMAQMNPTVGAISQNVQKMIDIIEHHQSKHDVIIFPELSICGYPPEDLLFRTEFHAAITKGLAEIKTMSKDCYILVGHPRVVDNACFNSVSIFHQGECIRVYDKQHLPNYEIFDEQRYFSPGTKDTCILEIKEQRIGVCICEDMWQHGPVDDLINHGATTVININASPFDYDKYLRREQLIKSYALQGINFIYVNQTGGQDELVFDGQSLAIDSSGVICARAPAFAEELCTLTLSQNTMHGLITPLLSTEALIYKALVCGTRDYVLKNKFPGVLLGLSGGIDSALTLTIAVDALGADKVHAVMMPSRFTASMSEEDALIQLEKLGVSHSTLSIEPAYKTLITTLDPLFQGMTQDTTEENIQARIRGILLMALSNKTGKMVLTTSNKSESAVGYATLYGDMAGGFAVLKDVLKTQVYALARFRNSLSEVIPERVITRAPSAELRENQTDQDSLPDYAILDAILTAYMEHNLSSEEIIQSGFSPEAVQRVISLLRRNEYKRRQAAPGIKISRVAFGNDWRYPITNGFVS